ncbi:MAG: hypothetical protein FJX97_08840 [Bacteroidetes bacterium]|nr:hypothetical protein [Bacteroidota bacterium]
MKQLLVIFLFLLITGTAWGQADSLYRQLERGEITEEEWYLGTLKLGKVSDDVNAWVQYEDQVAVNSKLYKSLKKKSGLIFHIPKEYQVIKANGNRFIQAYLFNLTDSTVTLPRMDATLDGFESVLYLNNTWVKVGETKPASCGNSYWSQKLEPNTYLSIQLENHDITHGKVKVRQKIKLKIGDQVLESKEIKALLFPNQLKFLVDQLD